MAAPSGAKLAGTRRRVTMGDVDAAGMLYLAVPYAWQEAMWTGVLYDHGHGVCGLMAGGVVGPVVSSSAAYLSPVGVDSVLACRLYTDHIGHSSFGVRMDAAAEDGATVLSVSTRHVWCKTTNGSLEPTPLPSWLRDLLS